MKLTKAERQFYKAYHHNWDKGLKTLETILAQPDCDRATALMIYWHASPAYYNQYASIEAVPLHERPVYTLIRSLEDRLETSDLPETIAYAPPPDRIPKDLGRIPEHMLTATVGARLAETILQGDAIDKAMFDACCSGDVDTVRALVKRHGLDLSAKYCLYTPIEVSVRHLDLFTYLVDAGVDWKKKHHGAPLLHRACRAPGLEVAARLLELGQHVDATGRYRRTALHTCVFTEERDWQQANLEAAARFLLQNGANPTATDADGLNALGLAERCGNRGAVELLKAW